MYILSGTFLNIVRAHGPAHQARLSPAQPNRDRRALETSVKVYFGERVAYYFCFLDTYNQSLIPIAIPGVLFSLSRPYLGTALYMQLLVVWGFFVSVIWSFWFLKRWRRHNSALNFAWKNDLHTRFLLYPNPHFRGSPVYNPITQETELVYAWWKRIPVYVFVTIFMLVQIAIMMFFIAAWIATYETFQIRFPNSGFGGVQWFCILGGGIVFGLFVDVVQWELVVKNMAHLCTHWENWRTTEQYERSLIRKLFCMDFLNIYTWVFLLAFVYVVPGARDTLQVDSKAWDGSRAACSISATWTHATPAAAKGRWDWRMFVILACLGVLVYTGLVIVSTGAVDFFFARCLAAIDAKAFRFGPSFDCFDMSTRLVMILRSVPKSLQDKLDVEESKFKWDLYIDRTKQGTHASPAAASLSTTKRHLKPTNVIRTNEATPLIGKVAQGAGQAAGSLNRGK
ncbi:Aste57867_12018 [Aphanomyces stellatus]|uniref:Aste57867_12018 protein n=1 Tax=Aphanomyces stellatus TaxID=120398 RepID=A0A485KUW5_9STRA|nr:hypothetical protein As57867_011973 [Aphanomyces stellatus]VFT88873.1 Aste57867_12018 [Aphanomyces stellatus]